MAQIDAPAFRPARELANQEATADLTAANLAVASPFAIIGTPI
jgi:hypothetical protein